MKVFILLLAACLLAAPLFAENMIAISGSRLPLIEGALSIGTEKMGEAQVYTCLLERHIDEVAEFYENFFERSGFQLMGGRRGNEYSVSVRKDALMFTLRIYSEDKLTVMQFIW